MNHKINDYRLTLLIFLIVIFLISLSYVFGENDKVINEKKRRLKSNELKGILSIQSSKVLTEYEERTRRVIEEPEIPIEIKINTQKKVYSLNDSIIVKVEFTNNSNNKIKFIKLIKPYNMFFHERMGRVINETTLIVEYPNDCIVAITPGGPDDMVYLSPGGSYSINFHINKNNKGYIGKDIFNYIGEYVISLDYIRKFWIIPDVGESRYTEQYMSLLINSFRNLKIIF